MQFVTSNYLLTAVIAMGTIVSSGRGMAEAAENTQTVRPVVSKAVLRNPGKGWILHGMPNHHRKMGSLAYGAMGYTRFEWCDIEPEEGQFDWSAIDAFVNAWADEGLPVAFGIMTANVHSPAKYVTPEWVFSAGCKPRKVPWNQRSTLTIIERRERKGSHETAKARQGPEYQIIPADWADPVFLAKLEALLKAVAKRYKGRLVWYEIRSYGNWGEGHLWPWNGKGLSNDEIYEHHLKLHRRVFGDTPLVAAETYVRGKKASERAVALGIGIRDDAIISLRNGRHCAPAAGKAPSAFVWGGTYQQLLRSGHWTKKGRTLEDCIRAGKVAYSRFCRSSAEDVALFLKNERPLIKRLSKLLGYRLRIEEATLPKSIRGGKDFSLELQWHNDGVAAMWKSCSVALALLNDKGKVVSQTWLEESRPGIIPGDKTRDEQLTARLAVPRAGRYSLAVGLFIDKDAKHPAVALGQTGSTSDRWHPLATVQANR